MRPDKRVTRDYLAAFAEIVGKIAQSLKGAPASALPVRMYVAGGAALQLHIGTRVSEDIDATFSRRLVLSNDLSVSYRDVDGHARVLYLDRNYNDSLGLLHEDAYSDSVPISIPGVDRKWVDVRLLSPLDLAVSKLSRFSDQDRQDIEALARERLISAKALRRRAEEALVGYIGNIDVLRNTIDIACRLIDAANPLPRRKE
jgi:Nucleotidyltransferase of unknown function (DUF6036)